MKYLKYVNIKCLSFTVYVIGVLISVPKLPYIGTINHSIFFQKLANKIQFKIILKFHINSTYQIFI